jgi:DeoR/GlpR family transcriptional regulator of sugar metabolism
VADASKIGQVAFAHIAPLTAASLLLTDRGVEEATLTTLRDAGLPTIQRV